MYRRRSPEKMDSTYAEYTARISTRHVRFICNVSLNPLSTNPRMYVANVLFSNGYHRVKLRKDAARRNQFCLNTAINV